MGVCRNNYRPQGNVFTPVCHSIYRGEGSAQPPLDAEPPDAEPPPPMYTPLPPGCKPLHRYGQQAGGMHPTGMHTCIEFSFVRSFMKK